MMISDLPVPYTEGKKLVGIRTLQKIENASMESSLPVKKSQLDAGPAPSIRSHNPNDWEECPECGKKLTGNWLRRHIIRYHKKSEYRSLLTFSYGYLRRFERPSDN